MEGAELKHTYPEGFKKGYYHLVWEQANLTMQVSILGDPKQYVIDGITKTMTFKDIVEKLEASSERRRRLEVHPQLDRKASLNVRGPRCEMCASEGVLGA